MTENQFQELIIGLVWGLSLIALYVWLALRTVGENERLVVFHRGKAIYAAQPGIAFVWPFVFTGKTMPKGAQFSRITHTVLCDGTKIPVAATFVFRISDFMKAATAEQSLVALTEKAVMDSASQVLSQATIVDCLNNKALLADQITECANQKMQSSGVQVVVTEIFDVPLPAQLIQLITSASNRASLGILQSLDAQLNRNRFGGFEP